MAGPDRVALVLRHGQVQLHEGLMSTAPFQVAVGGLLLWPWLGAAIAAVGGARACAADDTFCQVLAGLLSFGATAQPTLGPEVETAITLLVFVFLVGALLPHLLRLPA